MIIRMKGRSDEFINPVSSVIRSFLHLLQVENHLKVGQRCLVVSVTLFMTLLFLMEMILIVVSFQLSTVARNALEDSKVPFTYNDIKGAPLIDRIFNKFCTLLGKIGDTRASLYYYNASAKHDNSLDY